MMGREEKDWGNGRGGCLSWKLLRECRSRAAAWHIQSAPSSGQNLAKPNPDPSKPQMQWTRSQSPDLAGPKF